jgi:hypothetical protein
LNLRDGSTVHGPGELSEYEGTPLIETSFKSEDLHVPANYPGWITDRTRLRPNQRIFYHPGRRQIPVIERMLPSLARYTSIDGIPMHVLRYENNGVRGFHYEAANLEHGLFMGVSFDYNGWGEFLFLSFESPAAMVVALEGDLRDIDGYHLVTGLNNAGYSRDGTDSQGGRFVGRIGNDGPHGMGAYISPSGAQTFGMYESGELNGPGVTFRADGARSFGMYRHGDLLTDVVRLGNDGVFERVDPATDEVLGRWEPPFDELGGRWVAFDGDYDIAGISVEGDSFLHELDPSTEDDRVVATISSVNGDFLTGAMKNGSIPRGAIYYSDGRQYNGEVSGFDPAGSGVLVYPGDYEPVVGHFSKSPDGQIQVEETIIDFQVAYPVASEVEIRGQFQSGNRISLELDGSVWRGSFAVAADEAIPYSVYVNGNPISEEGLYPEPYDGEEYNGVLDTEALLDNPFSAPAATIAARKVKRPAIPRGLSTDENALRRAQREAAASDYYAALQRATRSYMNRAEAIRAQIQQERADSFVAVMATAMDVLEESGYVDTTDPGVSLLAEALRDRASRTQWYDDVRFQLRFQAAVQQGDYRRAKDLSIERMRENGGDPEVLNFLDQVSDVAFDSYEAAVAAQEAQAVQHGASQRSINESSAASGATTIDINPPAWQEKPNPTPQEVQLHTLVQAADHYYRRYAQAAQSGNAEAAEQLWVGHTESVSRAESLAAALSQ